MYEPDYNKALSFGLRYFHSFRIIQKGLLYDVIGLNWDIPTNWKTIKEVN